jgi:hypothetical protein
MKPGKQILVVLSCGGMEITWRYAWALFLTLGILKRPFPLSESVAVFAMASLVTVLSGFKSWRLYQSLLLHIAGFTIAWLLTTYRFFYRHLSLFNISWTEDLFKQLQQPQQWLIQLLVFACLLLFWLGARAMMKRQQSYYPVCLQFDKGLGALFLLLLIKFMVQEKGGIRLEDAVTRYLLLAFFTFSLIAISLSRNQNDVQKTFRPGYHGIGILLGFFSVVLIGGAVLIVLSLPYLTLMADSAQSVLKETTGPMGPVLVNIIRFLLSLGGYRSGSGIQVTGGSNGDQLYPDAEIGAPPVIGWILLGGIGLFALGLCGYLIHLLVRWLLKRNTLDKSKHQPMDLLSELLSMIGAICRWVWNGLRFLFKRIDSATAIYAGMLRWGRRSGVPAVLAETPIEYGSRLSHYFPALKEEIEMIIDTLNLEVYENVVIDERRLARIRFARHKMRSPRHWLLRLRGWLVQHPLRLPSSRAGWVDEKLQMQSTKLQKDGLRL